MPADKSPTYMILLVVILACSLMVGVYLRVSGKSYTPPPPPDEKQISDAAALIALPPGSLIETTSGIVLVTRKGGWEGASNVVATRYAEDMPRIQDASDVSLEVLAYASPSDPNYAALASEFLHTLAQRPPQ